LSASGGISGIEELSKSVSRTARADDGRSSSRELELDRVERDERDELIGETTECEELWPSECREELRSSDRRDDDAGRDLSSLGMTLSSESAETLAGGNSGGADTRWDGLRTGFGRTVSGATVTMRGTFAGSGRDSEKSLASDSMSSSARGSGGSF
jgi:hypothetical protein